MEQWLSAEGEDEGEHNGDNDAPEKQASCQSTESLAVGSSAVFAAQGFGGIGQPVEEEGSQGKQGEQQGVGREHQGALAGTEGGEKQVDHHQKERAQEYVAVHCKEAEHPVVPLHAWLVAVADFHLGEAPLEPHHRHAEACPLGYHRAQGYSLDTESESEDQGDGNEQVGDVLRDGDIHGDARVLHADEPSGKAVESHHGRGSPYAYRKVGVDGRGHRVVGLCFEDLGK